MKKHIFFFIFCLGFANFSISQDTDSLLIDSTLNNQETNFQDSIANFNLQQKSLKLSRDAYNKGIESFELNNFTEAIHSFSKAIGMDSSFIAAYFNRGVCYSQISDYDNAIADFSLTFSLDSRHIFSLFKRAEIYRNQYKNNLALTDYKWIIEIDDKNLLNFEKNPDLEHEMTISINP